MPREAIKRQAVDYIVELDDMAERLLNHFGSLSH
ncbi:hypothetical protein L9G15_27380 [Shewanella sp. A3A]|nr:hypothetical protein [Shewanella ferrihydritica]MCH1928495.1 hypothetical protein [Shewanella electrica]